MKNINDMSYIVEQLCSALLVWGGTITMCCGVVFPCCHTDKKDDENRDPGWKISTQS